MAGNRSVVHGCSNVADLNTGVSLHNSPELKESARYFGDFCDLFYSNSLLWAGVQYRCLVINRNSSQGRF